MNFSFLIVFIIYLSGASIVATELPLWRQRTNCVFCNPDPEIYMNATQLITSKGYPCEDYSVLTSDGFLLGVQRIPFGRNKQHEERKSKKPVVFLQHGLLAASSCWLTNLANESLAFILADNGFDVWLGNFRGNTYSRCHTSLSPNDVKFWDWSWDEMSSLDVTAMVDFALKTSNQSRLDYIGHSEGTLVMFALLSRNPKFASKINHFFALGPVTTVGNIEGVFHYIAYLTPEIIELFDLFGEYEFMPKSDFIRFLSLTFCTSNFKILCEDLLFLVAGADASQLNVTRIPIYGAHTPAGTSTKNMVHFAQMVRSGNFQMFDYGSAEKNMIYYKQKTAPLYYLSNITTPVYLFSGEKDKLANKKDVTHLSSQLKTLKLFDEIPAWNHLDFLWAMDAPTVLYKKIMDIISHSNY